MQAIFQTGRPQIASRIDIGPHSITTDLSAFQHFGKGQATCYGPVAENIHAANERVKIGSVIHVAKTYALFLARWCGLAE